MQIKAAPRRRPHLDVEQRHDGAQGAQRRDLVVALGAVDLHRQAGGLGGQRHAGLGRGQGHQRDGACGGGEPSAISMAAHDFPTLHSVLLQRAKRCRNGTAVVQDIVCLLNSVEPRAFLHTVKQLHRCDCAQVQAQASGAQLISDPATPTANNTERGCPLPCTHRAAGWRPAWRRGR